MASTILRQLSSSLIGAASLWVFIAAALLIGDSLVIAAEFPLASQTFRIKSVIKPYFSFSKTLRITEDYSYEQKRARIQYSRQDGALKTFYYNDNQSAGVQYKMDSSAEDQCKRSTVEEFNLDFYEAFKGLDAVMNEFENAKFSHIVGPAKLLLMIAARSNELKRVSENSTQVILGGKQDLIQFELDLLRPESPEHDKETMIIYYDAASFNLEPSPETQLPKLISLPSFRIAIIYSRFELNFEDASSAQNERMDMRRIEVDHFSFPTSDKCSGQLSSYDLFTLYNIQTFGASFSALSEDSTGLEEEHLVELDGFRQVLRVDKYNYGTSQSTSDIFDLRMDRRYMVWEDKTAGDGKEEEDGRCIMVKNMGNRRVNVHMDDLLIGGHQGYSLLGRAKVRGINALVYSVPALNLPYWYDKPVVYKRDQVDWLRRRGRTVYDTERDFIVGFYTLVYVSDSIEDRLKLLAMEVMQANSMHLLTVHFYDFIWQLSEPASGLHLDQLFSPIESCSAGARDDNYVDVSLVLEQGNPPSSADEVKGMKTVQQKNDNTNSSWIDYWPLRDGALLASISDSLEIDVTMIHDLESKIIRTDSECRIDVNFRVSERPLWLHELNYVGGADMRPAGSYIRGSDGILMRKHVQSLRDCLDLVVPSNNLTYVYYSELDSACMIDLTLNGLEVEKLHQLGLISQKGKPSIGELYQVITRRDSVNFMQTLLRDGSEKLLENRLLILSHSQADPAMPIDPHSFNMRIKRINLQNVNYLRRDRGGVSHGKGVLSGYTLVPVEDNTTYIVESRPTYEGNLPLKNLADCQAACIADFTCESYSFCIYFPETVCTLSQVTFTSIESSYTSNQFETKTREGPNRTTLDSPQHNTLRKDFRCEIHEKRYSDYFYNKHKTFILLDDFLARPANNSDDCARSCAQETVERLQEQIHLQETMHGPSRVGMEQQAEFIDQYKNDMRKICQQFHYILAPIEQVRREAIQYYLGLEDLQQNNEVGGYCLFDQHNQSRIMENRKGDSPFKHVSFKANLYELDFSKLYKRESGFRLIKSEQTKEEQGAALSYAANRSEEKATLLIQLDSRGKNVQYTFIGDERRCAQLCFYQYAGLCRSFDTFQEKLPGGLAVNKCNLNSQSIMRYNLAGKNADELKNCMINETNVWHYELRWDILVKPLIRSSKATISSITDGATTTTTTIGEFAILLVVIASILSGLAFGLRLGQRLSPPRGLLNVPDITDPLASQ